LKDYQKNPIAYDSNGTLQKLINKQNYDAAISLYEGQQKSLIKQIKKQIKNYIEDSNKANKIKDLMDELGCFK